MANEGEEYVDILGDDESDSSDASSDSSSEAESLGEVDADVEDIIPSRIESYDFGSSHVNDELIKSMEDSGYFPRGDARCSGGETVPSPQSDEVIVFRDYFLGGLRFPAHPFLAEVLDRFNLQIHHLTPNSFVQLSKFIWASHSFGGVANVEVFCKCYDLHYQSKKFTSEEGLHVAQFGSCTFCPRLGKRKPKDAEVLIKANKNKWNRWERYWFYLRTHRGSGWVAPSRMERMAFKCTSEARVGRNDTNDNAFRLACLTISGRDAVEEFIAAGIWPLGRNWQLKDIRHRTMSNKKLKVTCPDLKAYNPDQVENAEFVGWVESEALVMCGPYTGAEHRRCVKLIPNKGRLNRVFELSSIEYTSPRVDPDAKPARKAAGKRGRKSETVGERKKRKYNKKIAAKATAPASEGRSFQARKIREEEGGENLSCARVSEETDKGKGKIQDDCGQGSSKGESRSKPSTAKPTALKPSRFGMIPIIPAIAEDAELYLDDSPTSTIPGLNVSAFATELEKEIRPEPAGVADVQRDVEASEAAVDKGDKDKTTGQIESSERAKADLPSGSESLRLKIEAVEKGKQASHENRTGSSSAAGLQPLLSSKIDVETVPLTDLFGVFSSQMSEMQMLSEATHKRILKCEESAKKCEALELENAQLKDENARVQRRHGFLEEEVKQCDQLYRAAMDEVESLRKEKEILLKRLEEKDDDRKSFEATLRSFFNEAAALMKNKLESIGAGGGDLVLSETNLDPSEFFEWLRFELDNFPMIVSGLNEYASKLSFEAFVQMMEKLGCDHVRKLGQKDTEIPSIDLDKPSKASTVIAARLVKSFWRSFGEPEARRQSLERLAKARADAKAENERKEKEAVEALSRLQRESSSSHQPEIQSADQVPDAGPAQVDYVLISSDESEDLSQFNIRDDEAGPSEAFVEVHPLQCVLEGEVFSWDSWLEFQGVFPEARVRDYALALRMSRYWM